MLGHPVFFNKGVSTPPCPTVCHMKYSLSLSEELFLTASRFRRELTRTFSESRGGGSGGGGGRMSYAAAYTSNTQSYYRSRRRRQLQRLECDDGEQRLGGGGSAPSELRTTRHQASSRRRTMYIGGLFSSPLSTQLSTVVSIN